jgi:hypothetical protein
VSFNLWLMFLVVILRKSKEGIKKQEKTLLFTFKISFSGIAIMSSPAATSGYLNKKKNYTKLRATKWNRRFFSIEEGNLNWRNIPCSRIKGSIDLCDDFTVQKVTKNRKTGQGKENESCHNGGMFVVTSNQRKFFLETETSEDCDRWVKSIQLYLEVRARGRQTNAVTESNRTGVNLFDTKKRMKVEKSDFASIDWTETQRQMLDDFLMGTSKSSQDY